MRCVLENLGQLIKDKKGRSSCGLSNCLRSTKSMKTGSVFLPFLPFSSLIYVSCTKSSYHLNILPFAENHGRLIQF